MWVADTLKSVSALCNECIIESVKLDPSYQEKELNFIKSCQFSMVRI
jgi:hypothetical protein